MRANRSFELRVAGALTLALTPVPAAADYPGSTQPGASPVPAGNLLLIRAVPPRNAIIPGAGPAITAPTAPPSTVFANIQGVGSALTDSEAASVTGSAPMGQGGKDVAAAIDGVLQSRSMLGGAAADRSSASGAGGVVSDAVESSMGAVRAAVGSLGGLVH